MFAEIYNKDNLNGFKSMYFDRNFKLLGVDDILETHVVIRLVWKDGISRQRVFVPVDDKLVLVDSLSTVKFWRLLDLYYNNLYEWAKQRDGDLSTLPKRFKRSTRAKITSEDMNYNLATFDPYALSSRSECIDNSTDKGFWLHEGVWCSGY